MNVVLDTNVLISATLWQGSVSQKLLFSLIRSDAGIFTSEGILKEYRRVLKRDFEYVEEEIDDIVEKIRSFAKTVKPKRRVSIVIEDPDDDKIVECALESASKFIITYDKQLLKLMEFEGIRIVTPETMLKGL